MLKQIKVRYTCEFDVLISEEEELTQDKLEELSNQIKKGCIGSSSPVHYDVRKADLVKAEIISEAVPYVEE